MPGSGNGMVSLLLPINENTRFRSVFIFITFRFKFENKSTNRWITLNLTIGQVKDLQPFIEEYVQ